MIIIIAITAGTLIYFYQTISPFSEIKPGAPKNAKRACTQEAKVCPDGSTVGRSGASCEFAPCPVVAGIADKLVVSAPRTNDTIASPVAVSGQAVGNWFSEGVFPVAVYDSNDKLLGQAQASFKPKSATDTWMTTNFVDFSGSVTFSQPTTASGYILFKKDNPSGNPAMDESFKLVVKFKQK